MLADRRPEKIAPAQHRPDGPEPCPRASLGGLAGRLQPRPLPLSPRQATLGPVTLQCLPHMHTGWELHPSQAEPRNGERENRQREATHDENQSRKSDIGEREGPEEDWAACVQSQVERDLRTQRRRAWDEGIIIWGGDPRCLWAKSLSSGLCCTSCHWAAQSPRDPESSLLAPHHRVFCHLLVRRQTATVLAWLPWQNLGDPQGTLSFHKEEAVRESPGRC